VDAIIEVVGNVAAWSSRISAAVASSRYSPRFMSESPPPSQSSR